MCVRVRVPCGGACRPHIKAQPRPQIPYTHTNMNYGLEAGLAELAVGPVHQAVEESVRAPLL